MLLNHNVVPALFGGGLPHDARGAGLFRWLVGMAGDRKSGAMPVPHLQTYTAILVPCEEGGFTSLCLEVNGAVSQGETEEEALENLKEATMGLLELEAEMKLEWLTARGACGGLGIPDPPGR